MTAVIDHSHIPEKLQDVMEAICRVAVELSETISLGPIAGNLGGEVGVNSDGDGQKELDVQADEAFAQALTKTDIRFYASEERETVEVLNPEGSLALAIDPLDGSSNIDVNVSIGTIFSIFEATDDGETSFLRSGRDQLAGGYVIYGPQTALVVTFGNGTQEYVLDRRTGEFRLTNAAIQIPVHSQEYAINASNYRHWSAPVRAYIDDCIAGQEGPREQNYNMRWVASLVAETHRIVSRGGIFLYPGDDRKGYENGRLRRIYECAPIAFLVEQAGGKATDGTDAILDGQGTDLHGRTPFVFGSAEKVDRVATYHDLPEHEVSALFAQRGLFRN